jgi:sortase A
MNLAREPRSFPSPDRRRRLSGVVMGRVLPWILLATGAGLLLYTGSQYWRMHLSQQQMGIQWQKQQAPYAALPRKSGGAGDSRGARDSALTRLQIPRISLDAIVGEGTSQKQLLEGPGHLEHTALPGEPGNAVITAHRDTFFRHLSELEAGDKIVVQRKGHTLHYEVTGKKIVKPEDVSVIAPSHDTELTLITCYPTYYVGPAPERLAVFSKLAH